MHHTEGKVGGPLAWRNTLESVVYEAWKCINVLQSSLVKGEHLSKANPASALISVSLDTPPNFTPKKLFEFPAVSSDPLVAIQVLLSRLNNIVIAIEALFRYVCQRVPHTFYNLRPTSINPSRPVLIPISTLADITLRLLRSTEQMQTPQSQTDAVRIQLERQVVPELIKAGATLSCILVTRSVSSSPRTQFDL
jgi:hypothetical protein